MIKTINATLNKYLAPLRALPYGGDGKYVHAVLGAISVLGLFLVLSGTNLIGLSLWALFTGITIEIIQKRYLGGTNTTKESIFDTIYTWIGGTIIAYALYLFGFIILYYGA